MRRVTDDDIKQMTSESEGVLLSLFQDEYAWEEQITFLLNAEEAESLSNYLANAAKFDKAKKEHREKEKCQKTNCSSKS